MNKQATTRAAVLAAILARGTRWATAARCGAAAADLVRQAATLRRLYEVGCNGHPARARQWSSADYAKFSPDWEKWETRQAARADKLEKRISALVRELAPRVSIEFQRDPRGLPVELISDGWLFTVFNF